MRPDDRCGSRHSRQPAFMSTLPTALTSLCALSLTPAPRRQAEHDNMTTASLLGIVGYDNLPQNTSGANADSHQPPACRNSNTADFRDCSASVHRRFVHQRVRQIDNTVIRLVGKAEIFRRPRPRSIRKDSVEAAHRFPKSPLSQDAQFAFNFVDRPLDPVEDFIRDVTERLSGGLQHQVALLHHLGAQSGDLSLQLRTKLIIPRAFLKFEFTLTAGAFFIRSVGLVDPLLLCVRASPTHGATTF